MESARVRIDELRLRAPGLTPEQGRLLGEAVARRLADLPVGRSGNVPALALSVPLGGPIEIESLGEAIAARIRRGLARDEA